MDKKQKDRQNLSKTIWSKTFAKRKDGYFFQLANAKTSQIWGEKGGSFAPHILTTQIHVRSPAFWKRRDSNKVLNTFEPWNCILHLKNYIYEPFSYFVMV